MLSGSADQNRGLDSALEGSSGNFRIRKKTGAPGEIKRSSPLALFHSSSSSEIHWSAAENSAVFKGAGSERSPRGPVGALLASASRSQRTFRFSSVGRCSKGGGGGTGSSSWAVASPGSCLAV